MSDVKRFSVCTEMDSYAYAKEDANGHWVRYADLATLTQERDALREVTRALIRAGDALYVRGKFADPDYWASCNWATVVEESANLLPPSGEAGKGGGV